LCIYMRVEIRCRNVHYALFLPFLYSDYRFEARRYRQEMNLTIKNTTTTPESNMDVVEDHNKATHRSPTSTVDTANAGEKAISTGDDGVIEIDKDVFIAAFILTEMANSGPAADLANKDFVPKMTDTIASARTTEATKRIKKEESSANTSLRRSKRNKPSVAAESEHPPPPAPQPELPASEPLNLDENEGFMPSAANNFKFKHDSPTDLRSKELDMLLKPPQRPKAFPADLAGEKVLIAKSYKVFGTKPKANLANHLVNQMELDHAQRQEEVEMVMAEDDRWSELWGTKEWEE
jgi:hypothetical protein